MSGGSLRLVPGTTRVFDILFFPKKGLVTYTIESLKTREEAEECLAKALENPEQAVRKVFPTLEGPYEKDQFDIDDCLISYIE